MEIENDIQFLKDYKTLLDETSKLIESYDTGIYHKDCYFSEVSGIRSIKVYRDFDKKNKIISRIQVIPTNKEIEPMVNLPLSGRELKEGLKKILKEVSQ